VRGLRPGIRATIKSFARASKKAQDVEITPSRDRRAQQPAPTAENRTRVSNSVSDSDSNSDGNSVGNSGSSQRLRQRIALAAAAASAAATSAATAREIGGSSS
jgi:hypothetical protein